MTPDFEAGYAAGIKAAAKVAAPEATGILAARAIRSLRPAPAETREHCVVVCHDGPGRDDWRARCSCGWTSANMSEAEADEVAFAHRQAAETREPPEAHGATCDIRRRLKDGETSHCTCGAALRAPPSGATACAACNGSKLVRGGNLPRLDDPEWWPCPDCGGGRAGDCLAHEDGQHRAWHDEGPVDLCKCGREMP